MKGGEEEREKVKGRKRRSEHRDRSVILLDSARSPVTFECSVDFTLAKGEEHRRKKKKTRTSIPSFSLRSSPFSPSLPSTRFLAPFLRFFHLFSLFLRQFSFDPRNIATIYILARGRERDGGGWEGKIVRERERRIDRDSP